MLPNHAKTSSSPCRATVIVPPTSLGELLGDPFRGWVRRRRKQPRPRSSSKNPDQRHLLAPWHNACDEPARQAHLDNGDQRRVHVEGRHGSAQVVSLALLQLPHGPPSVGSHPRRGMRFPRRSPHRICTAATAADFQLVPWQWRIAIKYAAFREWHALC